MRYFKTLALTLLLCLAAFSQSPAQEGAPAATEQQQAETRNLALCLSHAKQIALACKLYADDNGGSYPAKLSDLVPTYISDVSLFISPLSAKKEAMGYDYYSEAPGKVLLRSKDATPDGRRVIAHPDCSGEITTDRQAEKAR